jgi:hypothetical protein
MSIQVKGLDKALKLVKDLPKQARFAASRAINDCALDVQKHEVETQLPGKLTLRSKGQPWYRPGAKFGVNARFATRENLTGVVGSQADWLKLQEEGGIKTGNGHRVAIPTPFWKQREEIMQANKKPRKILEDKLRGDAQRIDSELAKAEFDRKAGARRGLTLSQRREQHRIKDRIKSLKRGLSAANRALAVVGAGLGSKPFEARLSSGAEGIFVRTSAKRNPIKALFWYVDKAKLKGGLEFVKSGQRVVNKVFDSHFGRRIRHAILTIK